MNPTFLLWLGAAMATFLGAAIAPASRAGDVVIYRCTDASGALTLQNAPCPKGMKQEQRTLQGVNTVPMALFGALVFTFLKIPAPMPHFTDAFTSTLNIYSQVGLVTLIGLIARNGILVVEFANKLQEQGKAKLDAIREASVLRLRPVMMTSLATIAGHTPLIFATGAGAGALHRGLGRHRAPGSGGAGPGRLHLRGRPHR